MEEQPADTLLTGDSLLTDTACLLMDTGKETDTADLSFAGMMEKDTVTHPELLLVQAGTGGTPRPYTLLSDDLVTGTLLVCFLLAALGCAVSRFFLWRQIKQFFYVPKSGTTEVKETVGEYRFQWLLVLQTCLLSGLLYYLFLRTVKHDGLATAPWTVVGIGAGVMLGYFLLKQLIYQLVNPVFFDKKKVLQWRKSSVFLFAVEGCLLFPLPLLLACFDFSSENALIYLLTVVIFVKILFFCKVCLIFFRFKSALLQIILYFCALEIVPLLFLFGGLVVLEAFLKVNY